MGLEILAEENLDLNLKEQNWTLKLKFKFVEISKTEIVNCWSERYPTILDTDFYALLSITTTFC